MTLLTSLLALLLLAPAYALWIYISYRNKSPVRHAASESCAIAVFLGSGGHTTEALQLLAGLDRARYYPRTYIVSAGDALSVKRAIAFEGTTDVRILEIPRARHVHQPLCTVPFTFTKSFLHTTLLALSNPTRRNQPNMGDILLMNGPGTCVVLCASVWVARLLGFKTPRMVYIESFARVRTLSLSGRIMSRFVDRFVVQWPELSTNVRSAECRGWLI
ncbi:oligosaccharide biosynthesis protein Alg14-like protein [Auriculariales sp. MPI-PUGE-AT-0066]|nr:oligosaccharide biosynthesis protein Alg14-like protein [Auriculariales sp. MPI-PUGE-AT-0066]